MFELIMLFAFLLAATSQLIPEGSSSTWRFCQQKNAWYWHGRI